MQGVKDVPELRGIIPNSFNHIFNHVAETSDKRFLVRCSFLEIYNEELKDLLNPSKKRLELKENADGVVYVKDLQWAVVKSPQEMDKLMSTGNKSRSVGATLMNEQSSRSHCIFSITVESSQVGADGEEHFRVGKLNLVDLAGSERQSKTGATGDRLKEATKINQSLSTLGNCISALVDAKSTHIPYRDSKLTRLLQDSLGGNAKTLMMATISPASYNYDETISTLRYANRAKAIKNKPKINEDPKDAMLREFEQEIGRLRKLLEGKRQGSGPSGVASANDAANGRQLRKVASNISALSSSSSVSSLASDASAAGVEFSEKGDLIAETQLWEKLERETAALMANKNIAEDERAKLQREYEERMLQLETQRMERLELQSKLMEMETQLLMGGLGNEGSIEAHISRQESELGKLQLKLSQQRSKQDALRQKIDEQQETQLKLQGNFASLQEKVQVKSRRLQSTLSKLDLVKKQCAQKRDEIKDEREELLDTIRSLDREILLRTTIIDGFISPQQRDGILKRVQFDEEADQWRFAESSKKEEKSLPRMASNFTRNSMRPVAQFAKISTALGDQGTRYRQAYLQSTRPKLPSYKLPYSVLADFAPYPIYDAKLQAIYTSGLYQAQSLANQLSDKPKSGRSHSGSVEVEASDASDEALRLAEYPSRDQSAPQTPTDSQESFPSTRNLLAQKLRYA